MTQQSLHDDRARMRLHGGARRRSRLVHAQKMLGVVMAMMAAAAAAILFLFDVNTVNAFSSTTHHPHNVWSRRQPLYHPNHHHHHHRRVVQRPLLPQQKVTLGPSSWFITNAFERPSTIVRCGAVSSSPASTTNLDAAVDRRPKMMPRSFVHWVSNRMRSFRKRGKSLVMTAALGLVLLFSTQLPAATTTTARPSTASLLTLTPIERVSKAPSIGTTTLDSTFSSPSSSFSSLGTVATAPRGGGGGTTTAAAGPGRSWERATERTLTEAIHDLAKYMRGPKSDTLILLLATALITPLCQRVKLSPILGFLASGMLLGPNGCGLISGIHTTETLAELGIVFFLFEMGIELSFNRLLSMRRDVFGLGFSQFMVTALAVAGVGKLAGQSASALVVLGAGLALSSSAFVLQLLKDKNQLATRFGKAAFGILLFQDLAVVPLLVVTPILAGNGSGLASALGGAVLKAAMALTSIAFAGRVLLNPLFKLVAQAQSQEAFLALILLTVLSMSFLTEGLGLSNTLGAFLAGVLLSETKYRYQVEADIAPFRGVLLGLFFVTVGFEIDVKLIARMWPLVGSLVLGILAVKTLVAFGLSMMFGLSLPTSLQTGLIVSQGGEFAFVAFGLARSLGILDGPTTKLMLTSVSLTMALTPLMASVGAKFAKKLEEKSDFAHYLGQDRDANEIKESEDFIVVVGYGAVGKVVCDLLDRKFMKYVGLEVDPNKAIQARNSGLPVFYGDIGRQEVAEAFNVGKAKAVVVCIAEKQQANRVLIALRRWYPDLQIFARAADADHANRLQNTLNVVAMVPILPEDNMLLTLPFGGAVMKGLGVPAEEVNAIVEKKRKDVLMKRGADREEEELALLQLGIVAKSANSTETSASKFLSSQLEANADKGGVNNKRSSPTTEAAVERRKAAQEKSPFVAKVIVEVCPDASRDDDVCISPEAVAQMIDQAGPNSEIEFVDSVTRETIKLSPSGADDGDSVKQ